MHAAAGLSISDAQNGSWARAAPSATPDAAGHVIAERGQS